MKKFVLILQVGLVITFADVGDEFEVDGIKYIVTSESPKEVKVGPNSTSLTGDIIIPTSVNLYTVTSISYFAFSECSELTSIIIPDSIVSIENSAFFGCSGLTSIIIGANVTFIGDSTFALPNTSHVTIYYLKNSANASYIENYSFPSNFELVDNTTIIFDDNNGVNDVKSERVFENTGQIITPNIFDTHFMVRILKPMVMVLFIPMSKILLYKLIKQFIFSGCYVNFIHNIFDSLQAIKTNILI